MYPLLQIDVYKGKKGIFADKAVPWFQRFIFIIFIAKGRGKINLWLKAAIDSSSRANQFELGSDPDSVS